MPVPPAPQLDPASPLPCSDGVQVSEAWKARVAQLIQWAVGEEREDGDIHLGLSCYCEAIFLVHRALSQRGADGKPAASPSLLAAVRPTMQAWTERALLLQSIIAEERIPPSEHPLLRALPPPPEPDVPEVHRDASGHGGSADAAGGGGYSDGGTLSTHDAAAVLSLPLPPMSGSSTRLAPPPPLPPAPPDVASAAPHTDDDEYRAIFNRFLQQQEGAAAGSSAGTESLPPAPPGL